MNLHLLIETITERILKEGGLPHLMAKSQNFDFSSISEKEEQEIKIELANYLTFCFASLFKILQIPTFKFYQELSEKEIIDFSLVAGIFLTFFLKEKEFENFEQTVNKIVYQ